MKIFNYGNDYVNERRQKSKEIKTEVGSPAINEPQNIKVDDQNQIPTGRRIEMEITSEKDATELKTSESETNQETETQEKKKSRTKKQNQETD